MIFNHKEIEKYINLIERSEGQIKFDCSKQVDKWLKKLPHL